MKLSKNHKNSEHIRVTIPIAIVRALGWQYGDNVEWKIDALGKLYLVNHDRSRHRLKKELKGFKKAMGWEK